MKVGFIGAGNMAGAIIRGMAANGFRGEDMLVYDTDGAKLTALFEECGICIAASGAEATAGVDALVLAVKPQVFPDLSAALHRHMPLVISIAAGKTLDAIAAMAGPGLPIIRVMPNINAKVGEAMSAFCGNELTTDQHRRMARRIFEAWTR